MSNDPDISDSKKPTAKSDTREIYSPQQKFRPANRFLTEVTDKDGDYSIILCNLPASVVVPMHSHADRETFHILSGKLDVYREDHWETVGPGDTVDLQNGVKHAWRNSSKTLASMLCVTTMRIARFIREIEVDRGSSDTDARRRFQELVQEHGYWLANPHENAAIGLDTNWGEDGK